MTTTTKTEYRVITHRHIGSTLSSFIEASSPRSAALAKYKQISMPDDVRELIVISPDNSSVLFMASNGKITIDKNTEPLNWTY